MTALGTRRCGLPAAQSTGAPRTCAGGASITAQRARGFTLVEVLVALIIVAIGLAALMAAVSGTARTSGYLRDKTLAQWIALNRLTEVRLNSGNKFAKNTDAAQVNFAGRNWHYDTRYFDTSIATMKRVVVRVYAGDSKTKGNPLAESTSFLGSALGPPGGLTTDWTTGTTPQSLGAAAGSATQTSGTPLTVAPVNGTTTPGSTTPGTPVSTPITPTPTPP